MAQTGEFSIFSLHLEKWLHCLTTLDYTKATYCPLCHCWWCMLVLMSVVKYVNMLYESMLEFKMK